jgi:hypothetical protein
MGTTITDLFSAIDRVLDEPTPVTSERQADVRESTGQANPGRQAEMQRLLELLCGIYLESDADGRAAIRAFIAERSSRKLWLMHECACRLAERVAGPGALPALRLALAAVSIEDCILDYRDTLLKLTDLYRRAERAGIDPQPVFEAMAARSTDSPTPGGCGSVAKIFRDVGSRAVW